MRKSDILTGACQGGPWTAHTLTSTNGLVWVRDGASGCYRFLFEQGVWQWRNGAADGQPGRAADTHVNGNTDAPRAEGAAPARESGLALAGK
jgi:hypothetical protein